MSSAMFSNFFGGGSPHCRCLHRGRMEAGMGGVDVDGAHDTAEAWG